MVNYCNFMAKGYCRDTFVFFKPICEKCSACIPMRLDVNKFKSSKSQRRILRKNKDIFVEVKPSKLPTKEQEDLYSRYNQVRHPDRDSSFYEQGVFNLHMGYNNSYELLLYHKGRIIGVSILDKSQYAISSAYFYWDPDYTDRSLGVFSALAEITFAQQVGVQYLYLGFYISEISNMSYKKYFRPAQLLINDEWVDFLP
jgi:leucyl-tRNA---protein transferase